MKISIGSDHAGYKVKEEIKKYLQSKGYEVQDVGTNSLDSCDYPIFGRAAAELVASGKVQYGILVCYSGEGIMMTANKVKGVRCGKINNVAEAIHGKERDYINIVALSGEGVDYEENVKIVDAFLNTRYNTEDQVYIKRLKDIEEYENRSN